MLTLVSVAIRAQRPLQTTGISLVQHTCNIIYWMSLTLNIPATDGQLLLNAID